MTRDPERLSETVEILSDTRQFYAEMPDARLLTAWRKGRKAYASSHLWAIIEAEIARRGLGELPNGEGGTSG